MANVDLALAQHRQGLSGSGGETLPIGAMIDAHPAASFVSPWLSVNQGLLLSQTEFAALFEVMNGVIYPNLEVYDTQYEVGATHIANDYVYTMVQCGTGSVAYCTGGGKIVRVSVASGGSYDEGTVSGAAYQIGAYAPGTEKAVIFRQDGCRTTTNGGSTWYERTYASLVQAPMAAHYCTADGGTWVAFAYDEYVYSTHPSMSSWTKKDASGYFPHNLPRGSWFANGYHYFMNASGQVYKTADITDVTSWTLVTTLSGAINGCVANGNLVVAFRSAEPLRFSLDGGETWSSVALLDETIEVKQVGPFGSNMLVLQGSGSKSALSVLATEGSLSLAYEGSADFYNNQPTYNNANPLVVVDGYIFPLRARYQQWRYQYSNYDTDNLFYLSPQPGKAVKYE